MARVPRATTASEEPSRSAAPPTGVQLLLAARREARERQLGWRISSPPPVLSEAIKLIDPCAEFALTQSKQEIEA